MEELRTLHSVGALFCAFKGCEDFSNREIREIQIWRMERGTKGAR